MATGNTVIGPGWIEATVAALQAVDGHAAVYSGTTQPWLRVTNFGFEIETGNVVGSVTLRLTGAGGCAQPLGRQVDVALTLNGIDPSGTIYTLTLDHELAAPEWEGPHLWGHAMITEAQVESESFGVLIRKAIADEGPQVRCDQVWLEITETGGG